MTEIYRAGFQLWKVRAVILLVLAFAGGACWYGWDTFSSYGLRPVDGYGGQLAPFGTRLAFGGFLALFGLVCAVGILLYGRLYAGRILYDEAANLLRIRTVELVFGGRELAVSPAAVEGADWIEGRSDNAAGFGGGVSVDAPWYKLHLKGRRLPVIVDAQGHFPDRALAARLLKL